jgi:MFS family permease
MLQPHVPEVVRRNFRIDLFGGICAGIYIAVVVGFMPVIIRRMGGSTTDVALVVAAPFIGHLLSPIGIYLLSGLPPVRVVAGVVTTGRIVFLAGVLVATTPLMLGATTVVFWVVNLANVAAYTTVMAAIYPDRERAQAMGKVRMGAAVSSLAAAAIAGILFDTMSATLVFAAATVVSFPGAVGFFWIREEGRAEMPPRRSMALVAREVWSDRRYRDLLTANTVFGLGNLMNGTVVPLMLVDHFNAPNTFVGAMTALTSAAAVISYVFWGRLIDRGSSLRLSAWNCALLVALPVTYLLAPSVWWLLPAAVIIGIVNAGSDIMFHTNIVQAAPRGRVLDYATAQSFLLGIRGTIAPFLGSYLIGVFGGSAYPVLFVIITLMVVGTVMYFRAAREFAPVREIAVIEPAPATT